MSFEETLLNVRGTKIQMLKGGSDDPLLYLHSAGGEVAWLPFFEQLSQHYTVYLTGHPGFSKSEGLEKIDTIEDLIFHYTDVMDHLGLTQPYVAGLSMGGWIVAEFATRYPQRIRKLALICAAGLRVPGAPMTDIFIAPPNEARHLVFYDGNSDLAKTFMPDVLSSETLENTMKAREASARVGWNPYFCNPKLRDRLYRITVPTLVIGGDSDRLVPLVHGHAYQEGITDAKLVIVEKCGYAPPFEKPAETVKALREFFHG